LAACQPFSPLKSGYDHSMVFAAARWTTTGTPLARTLRICGTRISKSQRKAISPTCSGIAP
jgi:hypothetical protein